jgi:hypothetical protein
VRAGVGMGRGLSFKPVAMPVATDDAPTLPAHET